MTSRRLAVLTAAVLAIAGHAHAQTARPPAPDTDDHGYVEVVGHSAFGNVTTQSYGVEVGGTVYPNVQIFGEIGNVRDVASTEISTAAQQVASALSLVQSAAVTYSVKQPVTFFGGGVRYGFAIPDSTIKPYIAGGFGVARVTNDVTFLLGGTDASGTLAQYVTLGSDLSGDVTKPMLTLGGGVVWPAWQHLIVDFRYRYGRIFTENVAVTVNRAGLGIGLKF